MAESRRAMLIGGAAAALRGGAWLRVWPIRSRRSPHLRPLVGQDRVRIEHGALVLDIEAGKAAWINAELVSAGIDVSELGVRERELEDAFLELTKCWVVREPR